MLTRSVIAVPLGLVLVAFAASSHAGFSTTLQFSMSDVSESDNQGYDILNVEGCHLAGEPGMPWLPCRSANFIIPRGQSVTNVQVKVLSKRQLPGSYYIQPAQPDQPTDGTGDGDSVGPDADVYNSTEPFPGEPVDEGEATSSWGWKVYQVMVWPLEYVPAKREVWLYESLDISLELGPSTDAGQEILPRGREQQEEWAAELELAVVNPEEIQPQAPGVLGPVPNPKRWILILPGDPEREGRDTWIDTFDPLVEWRQTQGLDTTVIYVKQITTASGEAAVQDIRDYLKDQHANHGARWACLVGDHEMIPWTYYNPPSTQWPKTPNDWCYCDLDGTWPAGHDWSPELWVGRVPCLTTTEAANFVGKVLAYEQDPGGGDHEYLYWAFYEQQTNTTCDSVIPHQDAAIQDTLWEQLGDPPYFPCDYEVVEEISEHHYNYVVVHCHGFVDLYKTMHGDAPECYFGVDDIDSLWNEDYYYFWYSISCLNAWLDYPDPEVRSIAEGATCMFPARCAVEFAGNTRDGLFGASTRLNCHAWDVLFPQGPFTPNRFNHAGGVEATSKKRAFDAGPNRPEDIYVRYSHNLFGDPATPIWAPRSMPGSQRPTVAEPSPEVATLTGLCCAPQPVSRAADLRFFLTGSASVSIEVFDLAGRLVGNLGELPLDPGTHSVRWDCSGIGNGLYLVRARSGRSEAWTKVIVAE